MPDDEFYLKSNDYEFKGKSPFSSELDDYVSQKPNKRLFGFIPLKDWAYNEVPPAYDSVFTEYYSYSVEERKQKLMDSLYVKYGLANEIGKNHWFLRQVFRTGAKPVILDTAKTQNSAKELEEFYFERGYFDAEVEPTYTIDSSAQKARVTYNVEAKQPSDIVEYNQVIQNAHLEELYAKKMHDSKVKINKRFDVRDFENERDRLTNLYENNGYFKFNEYGQELIFKIDSTDDKQLKATLKIAKPKSDSIQEFKQYHLGDITVMLNNVKDDVFPYKTTHKNYHLKSLEAFDLKPRVYTDAITIQSGDLYRKDDLMTTRKLILDRENFSLVSLTPEVNKESDSLLDVKIKLRPKEKYDLELSFEGMYSPLINFGISPGVRLLTRNVFKGGENLEFNLRGTVGTVNNGTDKNFFNAYELSFETKMTFPRWVLPLNTEGLVPKAWNPKSAISLGLSGQKNIGLGSRNYSAIMDYTWTPRIQSHDFELVNFQYIKNTERDKYYKIFTVDREIRDKTFDAYFTYSPDVEQLYNNDEINENQLEFLVYGDAEFVNALDMISDYDFDDYTDFRNAIFRKRSITQDAVIQSFSHAYSYNENLKPEKKHPWFISAKAEVAGALLRLLDATFGFEERTDFFGDKQALVGGVPYSEFVRFDLDVRKTIDLTEKSQLAFRSFTGFALPYGNIEILPFNKSYFGGGSNDVRAWRAYELSPAPLKPNDKGTYIDQMKITWNAEYRFPLVGMVNGALFVDAGNIWSLDKESKTQFKFNKFLSQMGVGSGFGLRFDFTFVIARLDFAYKIHNPAYDEGNRWFNNVKIFRPLLQFGINYPF